jgi:predicted negative regulator of RcsB-dependent stress response
MSANPKETSAPLAEIAHGPGPLERFLDKNQKLLVIFAILLVLAAAGAVVFRGVEHSRQVTAGAALSKAAGLPDLRKLVDAHGGTHAASSAAILLAEEQWSGGQQDAAIATLRQFIDANPKHPALASARGSLGSKLMTQGNAVDAAAAFQQIVDDTRSRYLAPYALISLGDLASLAGDSAKAESFYNRAKADHPESGFASTANERLATLNASMPTEVDPPPPAAEDAPPPNDNTVSPPAIEPAPQILPAGDEPAQNPPGEGQDNQTPPQADPQETDGQDSAPGQDP